MTDASPKPRSTLPVWRRVALTVLAIGLAIFLPLQCQHRESEDYLRGLEKMAADAEKNALDELAGTLAVLEAEDASRQLRATVSARVFQQAAARLGEVEFAVKDATVGDIVVRLERLKLDFRDGFPRITASGHAEARGQKISVEARAMLSHTLESEGVSLHVHCLGLAPIAEGVPLPKWAATIADAAATKAANNTLAALPFRVPIAPQLSIAFDQPDPVEQWVTTANGRVLIRITLPVVQPIVRHVHPRAVFFSKDGLHLVADLLTVAPPAPAAPLATKQLPNGDLEARLKSWRLDGDRDFWARAGSVAILELLSGVNQWPEAGRKLSFQGVKEEGHLMDRTGGAPFGNGFGAWLDGPDRLQGSVILQSLTPAWRPERQRLSVTAIAVATGSVQVHVHGNAPRISAPKIFGMKIGGGVKIGGGAGTSIGARVLPQEHSVTGAVQWNPVTEAFEVRLVEPGELAFKIDIGGVPDELEKLFKDGFKVPMPRDKPLYQFRIPSIIAQTVKIPISGEAAGGGRILRITADDNRTALVPAGLEVSSKLRVE